MTTDIFNTAAYRTLMHTHIAQTIHYLFEQNQEFGIACTIAEITFEPELPASIKDSFEHTVLFILSNYTFESAHLEKEHFIFEAGFGSENFGATVIVPLLAIKQIIVEDMPILFNHSEPPLQSEEKQKKESEQSSSMEALLNNPENQKLLKKKR